ncbi:MAG: hypothetical protein P8J59_05820 [Phycisphaerales bacterium]|nr:hypothetical protein [Phycisphaerales bacterium]
MPKRHGEHGLLLLESCGGDHELQRNIPSMLAAVDADHLPEIEEDDRLNRQVIAFPGGGGGIGMVGLHTPLLHHPHGKSQLLRHDRLPVLRSISAD